MSLVYFIVSVLFTLWLTCWPESQSSSRPKSGGNHLNGNINFPGRCKVCTCCHLTVLG